MPGRSARQSVNAAFPSSSRGVSCARAGAVSAAPNTMAAPKLVKQTRFFMAELTFGLLQNSMERAVSLCTSLGPGPRRRCNATQRNGGNTGRGSMRLPPPAPTWAWTGRSLSGLAPVRRPPPPASDRTSRLRSRSFAHGGEDTARAGRSESCRCRLSSQAHRSGSGQAD
jgi:hypothetical protein